MSVPPMNYVEPPDVPEGMTLAAYRVARAIPARRRRRLVRSRLLAVALARRSPRSTRPD